MAVHLNIDRGLKEAMGLLQEKEQAEFACIETKLHTAPQVELVSIFQSLARLTHVKQLFVKKFVNLPAGALAAVLSRQQKLEFLYLQNIKLSGEDEEFDALANAFRNHRSLRKVRFYMCRPSIRTAIGLDSMVTALSEIPSIEEVSIIHSRISAEADDDNWDGNSLKDLCSSNSLKVLTLTFGSELRDGHIEAMAEALQANTTLKNISIRASNLGVTAGLAMGRVLNSNRTLERLRVQLSSDEHAVPIVDALRKNRHLQRLGLVLPSDVNKQIREHFTTEMTNMLANRNYNLQDLDLVGWRASLEIRFYIKANQAGRRSLLAEGAPREQWVDTLISHKDDLSIMYYFLSRNPQLCLTVLRRLMFLSKLKTKRDRTEDKDCEENILRERKCLRRDKVGQEIPVEY